MIKKNKAIRLIVEGHSMTKKTSLINYWVKHNPQLTVLSGEWRTYLGVPLMCTEGQTILPPLEQVYKAYDTVLNMLELFPYQVVVFDRFHISQQFYDKLFNTHYYEVSVEERLAKMNTVILYLRNQFDCYEDALRDRLKKSQQDFYPHSYEEYHIQEGIFSDLVHRSSLPYIEYDVTKKTVEEISIEIVQRIKKLQLL